MLTFLSICALGFFGSALAHDVLYWNLESPAEFKLDLIQDAKIGRPVVVFSVKSFDLLDFNSFANVYQLASDQKKNDKQILKYMRASKGYGSEAYDDDFLKYLPEKGVLEYQDQADYQKLGAAKVVIVNADNLDDVESKVGEVLGSLDGRDYIAVILGKTSEISHHRIAKRQAAEVVDAPNTTLEINDTTIGCGMIADRIVLVIGDSSNVNQPAVNLNLTKPTGQCTNKTLELGSNPKGITEVTFEITSETSKSGDWSCGQANIKLVFNVVNANSEWHLEELNVAGMQLDKKGGGKVTLNPLRLTYKNVTGSGRLNHLIIESVEGFNFACQETPHERFVLDQPTTPVAKYVYITFMHLQVQPTLFTGTFDDNVDDCTGFFTTGIWMGLVVGLIMMLILLCAITMIVNLKTMDRFDDPKQKPLQINVKE